MNGIGLAKLPQTFIPCLSLV